MSTIIPTVPITPIVTSSVTQAVYVTATTKVVMPTTLAQLLTQPILFVVVRETISINSSSFDIQNFSLNAWGINFERARKVRFLISLLGGGKGIGCFPTIGVGIRYGDGKVFFSNRDYYGNFIDLSYLVKGYNFRTNGYKTSYKELQYFNC